MRQTRFKRLHPDATLPSYGYPGDAGMDLAVVGQHVLNPGESRDLPTGLAVEMPPGLWGRITSRSSTLRKRGLFVNEGVIDNGYRGELLVYVTNRNGTPIAIQTGDRLAQLILADVHQAEIVWVDELSESARGTNGFGSTDRRVEAPSRPEYDIYVGGAIDFTSGTDTHALWFHPIEWSEFRVYCPWCERKNGESAEETIGRNFRAMFGAEWAFFWMDGRFTIGTPIEAWLRAERDPQHTVLIIPSKSYQRGLFMDFWRDIGVHFTDRPAGAVLIMGGPETGGVSLPGRSSGPPAQA